MHPSISSVHQQQLGEIYVAHHSWLQGWLRQKMGNAHDAADLAHDAFIRFIGRMEQEAVRNPRAYLTTIASGLVVDLWRRRALEQAWLETLVLQPEPLALSAEEQYLVIETLQDVARLLEGLPHRVQRIFLYAQLEGWTYAQIAAHLGVTVNVVQKAMGRALKHCYRALYVA